MSTTSSSSSNSTTPQDSRAGQSASLTAPNAERATSRGTEFSRAQRSQRNREMILTVAMGGICLALSFVLSQIKLFNMPQGGTITPASMLPLIFFALCFGAPKAYCVAFLFSLLQLLGGYFVHPAQVLLDYILAFTTLGTAGLFAAGKAKRLATTNALTRLKMVPFWRIILAVLLSCALRCACHVLAGVIFFAEYAGEQNVWIYSIAYNGSFIAVEAGITCALLVGISAGLGMLRRGKST